MEPYAQLQGLSLISTAMQGQVFVTPEPVNKKLKICTLIPAYNAAATLEVLLTSLIGQVTSILVVDDGSGDHTAAIARRFQGQGVVLLRHKRNAGKGTALRTGFKWALERDFDVLATLDSDLQHLPDDLPRMVRALFDQKLDLLIGSRRNARFKMPFFRRTGNRFSSWIAGNFCRQDIEDSQCGYRLYRMSTCSKVLRTLQASRFVIETELILKVSTARLRIGFLPISVIYPKHDQHHSYYSAFGDTALIFWLYTWEFCRRNFTRAGLRDLRAVKAHMRRIRQEESINGPAGLEVPSPGLPSRGLNVVS